MGLVIGRFRKKKSTYEILENLEKQIKEIEDYRRSTEQSHKKILTRFISVLVGSYVLTAVLFYFRYFPSPFNDHLYYAVPFVFATIFFFIITRVLSSYYNWKISRKQGKLTLLRDQKKLILENVMETETYKVAKKILEKFAPELVSRRPVIPGDAHTPKPQGVNTLIPQQTPVMPGLRQRMLSSAPGSKPLTSQAYPSGTPSGIIATNESQSEVGRVQLPAIGAPVVTPRNILPRDRTFIDRLVDYLIGDGPSNRYALICKNCFSHNGMIFPEEFEYTQFRCCYCFTFNPARKKRPAAPKLELTSSFPKLSSDTSESEKDSPIDSESEDEPLLSSTEHVTPTSQDITKENKMDVHDESFHRKLVEDVKETVCSDNNEKMDINEVEDVCLKED